jgi:colicin import membrane protein
MTEPQIDSSKKKPIILVAAGITSLILAAVAGNFVVQGMKEAKIKEYEKQVVIQAEEERQAAIQEKQDKQAAIRRRETAEENEQERLANLKAEKEAALKAEAERKEQDSLASIEAEKAEKEAELKAALEAPRPWQLEVKVKSNSNGLENAIRGEK